MSRRWPPACLGLLLALGALLFWAPWDDPSPVPLERDAGETSTTGGRPAPLAEKGPFLQGRAVQEDDSVAAPPTRYAVWALVQDEHERHVIEGARVRAALQDGTEVSALTDARGLACLEHLVAPPVQVTASADGYATDLADPWDGLATPTARVLIELSKARDVSLRVLELESGRPVTSAGLVLHGCLMVRMNRSPYHLRGRIDVGRTDGGGRARLRLPAGPAGFVLEVRAEGRRATWWPVPDHENAAVASWTLRVPPGGAIEGVVRDSQGRPVPGVRMIAGPDHDDTRGEVAWPWDGDGGIEFGASPMASPTPWRVPLRATTDAKGRYRIDGVGLGEPTGVSARRDGYAPSWAKEIKATRAWPVARWDPLLATEGRLLVRVVDPDGRPIPGVYGSTSRKNPWGDGGKGQTNAQGILSFEGLTAGTYDVGLQPKPGPGTPTCQHGHAKYDNEKAWNLTVRAGETTEVVVVLPHGSHGAVKPPTKPEPRGRVRGIVVDEAGGPLEGIVVRDRTGAPWAVTDADGRFETDGIPRYGLTLGPNGPYGTTEHHEPPRDGSLLRIVARPARRIPVRLRILLPEGAPAPPSLEARLSPAWLGGVGFEQPAAEGAFETPWPAGDVRELIVGRYLPPGRASIRLSAAGYRDVRRRIEVGDGPFDETLTLDRGHVARGRVVDGEGVPVEGAQVTATSRAPKGGPWVKRDARAGEDGRFEIGGLAPGPWAVRAAAEGHLPFRRQSMRLDRVADGSARLDEAVVLRRGGRVRVTVVDAEGLPRSRLSVTLERDVESDASGRVRRGNADYGFGRTDLSGAAVFLLAPGRWVATLPSGRSGVPDLAEPQTVDAKVGRTAAVEFVLSN